MVAGTLARVAAQLRELHLPQSKSILFLHQAQCLANHLAR